jgi:hypothetical protein
LKTKKLTKICKGLLSDVVKHLMPTVMIMANANSLLTNCSNVDRRG